MSSTFVRRGEMTSKGVSGLRAVIYGDKIDLADELEEEFHQQAKDAMDGAAAILETEVIRRLNLRAGSASTVAPAGESPERDTGDLVLSVKRLPARVKGRMASSGVRVKHPGANRLENGFTDTRGVRTFPHPFMRPAIEATVEPISNLLNERLG